MVIHVDLAVHLFYGLGNDPTVPRRSSPYYTRFPENYGEVQAFIARNQLALDDYAGLLRQLWHSRFEEVARDGGYLAAVPNVNFLFPSDDGHIPDDERAYVFRHQKEQALLDAAHSLFGDRMIVHADPSIIAERLARKILHDANGSIPNPFEIEVTPYGEMSDRCVVGNGRQFERVLGQALQQYRPHITGARDLRYCGDRAAGKQEFLDTIRSATLLNG